MSSVVTYLNFAGNAEEAFNFYRDVFQTEFSSPLLRHGENPMPGGPELAEDERNLVMNVALPILGGHVIMATDVVPSMGHELRVGNNVTISLQCDSREEADRYFEKLSAAASEKFGMVDMFYGYWGTCLDQFGVRWMFNVASSAE